MPGAPGAGCSGLGAGRKGPKKLVGLISSIRLIERFGPIALIGGLIELIGQIDLIDQIDLNRPNRHSRHHRPHRAITKIFQERAHIL